MSFQGISINISRNTTSCVSTYFNTYSLKTHANEHNGDDSKIINAIRDPIHEYENLKGKLYNCNANIYFNRQY